MYVYKATTMFMYVVHWNLFIENKRDLKKPQLLLQKY